VGEVKLESTLDFINLAKDLGGKLKKSKAGDVSTFLTEVLSKGAKDPLGVDHLEELISSKSNSAWHSPSHYQPPSRVWHAAPLTPAGFLSIRPVGHAVVPIMSWFPRYVNGVDISLSLHHLLIKLYPIQASTRPGESH
jgi:hypothetical protein